MSNNLRIVFADDHTVGLYVGDDLIGNLDTGKFNLAYDLERDVKATGELVVELELLGKAQHAIRSLLNDAAREKALNQAWDFLSEHAPDVTEFYVETYSEGDDEGGSYLCLNATFESAHEGDVIRTESYKHYATGADISYDITVEDAWVDLQGEWDAEWLTDGTYTKSPA